MEASEAYSTCYHALNTVFKQQSRHCMKYRHD